MWEVWLRVRGGWVGEGIWRGDGEDRFEGGLLLLQACTACSEGCKSTHPALTQVPNACQTLLPPCRTAPNCAQNMEQAARDAISAQPTGHTLETTQVKLKVGKGQSQGELWVKKDLTRCGTISASPTG